MNESSGLAECLALEHLTLATSPAVHEAHHDGWILRASGTDTRRANSVTVLEAGVLPFDEKIMFCEGWYANHGQVPTFRLTSVFSPASLDARLAERGYRVVTPSHVMTAPVAASTEAAPPNLHRRSLADGIGDLHELKGSPAGLKARDIERQGAWAGPECHLAWIERGAVVACGMARVGKDWVGVFNMRTHPDWRRRGLGGRLIRALLQWGAREGASRAFLQVEQANEAAVALYRRHGFTARYDYHYRVRHEG